MEPKKYSSNINNGFFANNFNDSDEKDLPNMETKTYNKTQILEKKENENKSLTKVVNNPISMAARNLAAFVNESNTSKTKATDSVMSAKDVFKMIRPQTNSFDAFRNVSVPILAKGYKRGQMIDLNTKADSKLRAIQILKTKPIKAQDPNQIQKIKSKKSLNAIINKINDELNTPTIDNKRKVNEISKEENIAKKLKNDLIEAALKRKSIHENEVDIAEANAQEKYFTSLEKKEKLENKLLETTEIECNVISCRNCKYTAHSSSELCKKNSHKLVKHKAMKRFFKCKNCKNRSFTFNLLMPTKACSKCGQNSYEKTSMVKVSQSIDLILI
jgi:minichromosome maintenance protein 10